MLEKRKKENRVRLWIEEEKERLERTMPCLLSLNRFLTERGMPESNRLSLADLIRRPQLSYEDIAQLDPERPALPLQVIQTVECDIKYAGYIKRQFAEVRRQQRLEDIRLPEEIDYAQINGLRLEARQKLNAVRPLSLGQASRISGVNPADISVLLIWLGLK